MVLEHKQLGILSLNWKKLETCVEDLKITLILPKGGFLLMLFFTCVLKSYDNKPRNSKTITKSFFQLLM